MKKGEIELTQQDAENTPAGGVVVGKRDGQTMIYDDASLGGYFVGKLHSEGGIKMINKSTGQPLEVQGAEVIITAPAVNDQTKHNFNGKMMTNREILSKINSDGGGVSFADGGDIPAKINVTEKEYEYGGKMFYDSEIANHLGMNSTLKKGKQHFTFGNSNYDVDGIYNAIKKGKLRLKTKEVETFAMKYPVYDKKYSETVKTDFRKPNGIMVQLESGEEVLIDGNHRMNNAYLKGRKNFKVYYINDVREIAKFIKKNKFELGGENKTGGHLSKNKSLKQIAEMHNVSLAHINEELTKGLEVEKEHFADFKERTRVAKDHLVENPNYYSILAKAGLENGGQFNTKPFLDYYFEEIKDFLKNQNDIVLDSDFTFKHRGELFTIEPLIKVDKDLDKKIKSADFIILDEENDVVGEITLHTDRTKELDAYSQYFEWNNINFDGGGSVLKSTLVKDAKSGNSTSRDLNNYNDLLDVQADGAVGGDSGIFANGGGVGNEPKEGDLITNFGKHGVSIVNVDDDYVYWLDQYASKQYCKKSDLSLNNLDDDGDDDGYYEGERNNWICNKTYAKGGVVYDTTKPKVEKITIKETRFDGNSSLYSGLREGIVGKEATNVSYFLNLIQDYIGANPIEETDWISFYVNDGKRGSYYIDLNKDKKNTVKNVNPKTGGGNDIKRVIDANKYLAKGYDWTEFFGGQKQTAKGNKVIKIAVTYDSRNTIKAGMSLQNNTFELYNFLRGLHTGDYKNVTIQPIGNGLGVNPEPLNLSTFSWDNLLTMSPQETAVKEINRILYGLFPNLNFDDFVRNTTSTAVVGQASSSIIPSTQSLDLSNTKVWIGDDPKLSEEIQKIAFSLGWSWGVNTVKPENTYDTSLFFSKTKYISSSNERGVFDLSDKKEINPQDILLAKKPVITTSSTSSASNQSFDFTDTKIDVSNNPDLSQKVQKRAFENGWEWENGGGKTIDYNTFNYLYFTKTSISSGNTTSSFINSPKRTITEAEIFGKQTSTSTSTSQPQYPEYYEFVGAGGVSFTKGKIYKVRNPKNLDASENFIDNDGYKNGFGNENSKMFIPSTEKAYLEQQLATTNKPIAENLYANNGEKFSNIEMIRYYLDNRTVGKDKVVFYINQIGGHSIEVNLKDSLSNFYYNKSAGLSTRFEQLEKIFKANVDYGNYDWTDFFAILSMIDNEVTLINLSYETNGIPTYYSGLTDGEAFINAINSIESSTRNGDVSVSVSVFYKGKNNTGSFTTESLKETIDFGKGRFVPSNWTVAEIKSIVTDDWFDGKLNFDKFFSSIVSLKASAQTSTSSPISRPLLTDLSMTKIWIGDNPELSKRVQERAFELGWEWLSGKDIRNINKQALFFTNENIGADAMSDTKSNFNERNTDFKEIFADDLFGSATASTPTQTSTSSTTNTNVNPNPYEIIAFYLTVGGIYQATYEKYTSIQDIFKDLSIIESSAPIEVRIDASFYDSTGKINSMRKDFLIITPTGTQGGLAEFCPSISTEQGLIEFLKNNLFKDTSLKFDRFTSTTSSKFTQGEIELFKKIDKLIKVYSLDDVTLPISSWVKEVDTKVFTVVDEDTMQVFELRSYDRTLGILDEDPSKFDAKELLEKYVDWKSSGSPTSTTALSQPSSNIVNVSDSRMKLLFELKQMVDKENLVVLPANIETDIKQDEVILDFVDEDTGAVFSIKKGQKNINPTDKKSSEFLFDFIEFVKNFDMLARKKADEMLAKYVADESKLYTTDFEKYETDLTKAKKDLEDLKKLLPAFQETKFAPERALIISEIKKLNNKITKDGFIFTNELMSSANQLFTPQGLLKYYFDQTTQSPVQALEPACNLPTPNGEKSKLPLSAYFNVRTKQFKDWFGDWEKAYENNNYFDCSKMIDEETKEPKIFFHGVRKYVPNFGQFSNMGQGVVRPYGSFEPPTSFPASYFSDSEDYAKFYGGIAKNLPTPSPDYEPFIYKVFLSVKNPLNLVPLGFESSYKDLLDYLFVAFGIRKTPSANVLSRINNDMVNKHPVWVYVRNDISLLETIKEYGYDALIQIGDIPTFDKDGNPVDDRTKSIKEEEFLTFYPTQVKSATVLKSFYFDFFKDIRFNKGGYVCI